MTRGQIAASVALLLTLAGCGSRPADGEQLLVVASTSVVGDLVSRVVGDEAQVDVIIPVGADPHDFAPSARQAASLRGADLVVTGGLGLEVGLADALLLVDDAVHRSRMGRQRQDHVRTGPGLGALPE